MNDKNKKIEKLDMDDLGKVAGGLSIGGRHFHSVSINEDLSKGDLDVNLNIGGENGGVEVMNHDLNDSITEDADSTNVELFVDENITPFDPN